MGDICRAPAGALQISSGESIPVCDCTSKCMAILCYTNTVSTHKPVDTKKGTSHDDEATDLSSLCGFPSVSVEQRLSSLLPWLHFGGGQPRSEQPNHQSPPKTQINTINTDPQHTHRQTSLADILYIN